MAQEFSFDIVCEFEMQEVKNAVDQVKKEIATRYDFKGVIAEIDLNDEEISMSAPDTMKLKSINDMLLQKIINRKLSPKILDVKPHEPGAQGSVKQKVKLIKILDQETCKTITKFIKDSYPKVKTNIQGETVRVISKDKDSLQEVIQGLKAKEDLKQPLKFTNYR